MTYKQATDWLFVQLPMYQNIGAKAYKIDLSNIIHLSNHLGNPHEKFKSIHVGGTNGKGSTSHMLASVLQEAGYKVGLYTSPHLKDFRERIRVNGQMIPESTVVDFVKTHQDFFKAEQLSFFEMTVGMAFHYFAYAEVDIAIIEVGLGGRLDSTNIITPEVSVITNIGLDHTQFLGDTHAKIAGEKAGIIKPNIPCVIGATISETKPVFEAVAKDNNAALFFAEEDANSFYTTDLQGSYQQENLKTAVRALKVLAAKGWDISAKAIEKGLNNVVKNTGLLGRWQVLNDSPFTVCDTAHNKEGLTYVLAQLKALPNTNLHVVLGFVSDKDLDAVLPLFPVEAVYYFTKPNNRRALQENILKAKAAKFGLIGGSYESVQQAFDAAKAKVESKDIIYVGGSTFVVAEII